MSLAMKSTRPTSRASLAEAASATSIVRSARSTACGPRRSANERTVALRMFLALASMVSPSSCPSIPTGLAAPMAVSGAMAATWPARVITVPALPAVAPRGVM